MPCPVVPPASRMITSLIAILLAPRSSKIGPCVALRVTRVIGSARIVTSTALSSTASSTLPWSLMNGLLLPAAVVSFAHGAASVHGLASSPVGATYATFVSSPHAPSGKHAVDAHSRCATQAVHVFVAVAQTGAVPAHEPRSSAVHATHSLSPVSQTGFAAFVHCALVVQPIGALRSASSMQLLSGWPSQ